MEPEGSLPHSQVPYACQYPEPAPSSLHPHVPLPEDSSYYPPIYTWVYRWSLSLRFPHQIPVYTSAGPHMCYNHNGRPKLKL